MTEPAKTLHRSCSSDHQFLFCKSETRSRESTADTRMPDLAEPLSHAFPEMMAGTTFLEKAMHHVEGMERFNALVIRIDGGNGGDDAVFVDEAIKVSHVVQRECKEKEGVWGWLGMDLFGSVFPARNDGRGIETADGIIRRVREEDAGSVTIGIARYPTIDFPKNRVLDNARKALDHATFFGPGSRVCFDAVSMNISGDQLYQSGDIKGAIEEFKKALELDPLDVNIHNSLGVCYGVLKENEKAAAAFSRAADLDPDEAMAVYNRGLICLAMEAEADNALVHFLKAEEIDNEIFEVQFQIGKLYLDGGDPEKGLGYLEKAARLQPDAGIVHRYTGDGHAAMGDSALALSAYKKAVKLNPNDPDALSAMGFLMSEVGENPEISTTFCRHSIEIAPDNGLFRHRLGRLYLKQGKLETALHEFHAAQELGHPSLAEIEKISAQMDPETDKKKFNVMP